MTLITKERSIMALPSLLHAVFTTHFAYKSYTHQLYGLPQLQVPYKQKWKAKNLFNQSQRHPQTDTHIYHRQKQFCKTRCALAEGTWFKNLKAYNYIYVLRVCVNNMVCKNSLAVKKKHGQVK